MLLTLYADDTVLFASSKENLQKCLDGLKQYCDKWKLEVNANKTKIIVFSKGKPPTGNFNFKIGDSNIEVVNFLKYLGVTCAYDVFFKNNVNELITNANRSIFGLIKKPEKAASHWIFNLIYLIRLYYHLFFMAVKYRGIVILKLWKNCTFNFVNIFLN